MPIPDETLYEQCPDCGQFSLHTFINRQTELRTIMCLMSHPMCAYIVREPSSKEKSVRKPRQKIPDKKLAKLNDAQREWLARQKAQ